MGFNLNDVLVSSNEKGGFEGVYFDLYSITNFELPINSSLALIFNK